MKRETLTIIFACLVLALSAQDVVKVNYKGAQPTICDFVSSLLSSRDCDEDDCCADEALNHFADAWSNYHNGLPLQDGQSLTIDEKNGYVHFESRHVSESFEHLLVIEMCYWNEADGKHKLFAHNTTSFLNGKFSVGQFDGITFYRYDNASKKMTRCDYMDVIPECEEDVMRSFTMPRTGKDITVTLWYDNGNKERTLKWDGHRFSF